MTTRMSWVGATVGFVSNLRPTASGAVTYFGTCTCGREDIFSSQALRKAKKTGFLVCSECAPERNDLAGPNGCRLCAGMPHRALPPKCPNCGTEHALELPGRADQYAWTRIERVHLGSPD